MMKLKSNQTRTYDGDGYKKRAACLCFRSESEEEAGVKGTLGRLVGIFEAGTKRGAAREVRQRPARQCPAQQRAARAPRAFELRGHRAPLAFQNRDRKHRTYVYVLIVTEVLEDWEDSVNIGRKREWFKIEDAIKVLQYHKPVQASYFETLRQGCLANNGTPVMTTTYSEGSVSDIR
ncbi:diphosphoinositol polyphosphate phosphohydrolase 1 isoform X2 [Columba livia]|uniref:diphosphoinositol polyphosphate phosphohydrolase 1 isoform X2 n=1 Tax=Columba livia TaxID=8932 RepID=UPI0031B9C583